MLRVKTRALLATLLLASLVLAGCASNNNSPNGGTTPDSTATTPSSSQLTPAGAKAMLESAAKNVPDKFGMSALVFQGARQIMSMNASFDNASKTSYVELRGDPAAFGGASASNEEAAALFQNGFSIYTTKEGSLYFANNTAFVFPPANESGKGSSLVPSPESSAFGNFLSPEDAVGAFAGSNTTVQSVTATTCHGQGAVRVVFASQEGGQNVTATGDLLNTNPPRLCHIETSLPKNPQSPADPFAGATMRADFYYNDELKLETPESVTRAVGLLYASSKPPFSFGGSGEEPTNFTWTFSNSAGIALSEVEVQVKDETGGSSSSTSGATDLATLPTKMSMKLSEHTKTQDGVTLTFTDVDGDGKVSKGDKLDVVGPSGEPAPVVVMKDLKTGIYVVPGFELAFVALAMLGAVALARRK